MNEFEINEKKLDAIEHKLDNLCHKVNTLAINSEINRTNIENKEKNDKSIAIVSWALIAIIISLVTYVEQLQISSNKSALDANYQYFSKDSNDQQNQIDDLEKRVSVVERMNYGK